MVGCYRLIITATHNPQPTDTETHMTTATNNTPSTDEFVSVPADMELVERAFDQHWRHDGGFCMIELTAFEAHRPRDLEIDAYLFNGALYYSDGALAWSIALEYLLD